MKTRALAIAIIAILSFASVLQLLVSAKQDEVQLTVLELKANGKPGGTPGGGNIIPPQDNSAINPDYSLLRFHWLTTAKYWVNPTGASPLSSDSIINVIQTSANTWDTQTGANVFSYQGVNTTINAGVKDGKNVVDWGTYNNNGVIAVTFIWSVGKQIVETDLRMNTYYSWSISTNGASGTMDVQSILTHEFGHWVGLNDLYKNADYWLTMYGYADNGQTWKQTLGQGDIKGLQAVYGL
jgi:hypothetical protein